MESIEPLFAYPILEPRITAKELARDIAAAGVPLETARARIAGYARQRQIQVRASGLNTSPNLYEVSDSAAGVILSAVQDAGIADHDVLNAVSLALYAWRDGQDSHGYRHPIDAAIVAILQGEPQNLVVNFWRDPQLETRLVDVVIGNPGREPTEISPTMTPRAALVIVLDDMLLPVARRLLPDTRN